MFFFSSGGRHTRLVSDWSSDVCSSDLKLASQRPLARVPGAGGALEAVLERGEPTLVREVSEEWLATRGQIGRASCRERVEISVGSVSPKIKTVISVVVVVDLTVQRWNV